MVKLISILVTILTTTLIADNTQSHVEEYCMIKAKEFKSKRLYQHTYNTCMKSNLKKNLSKSDTLKMLHDDVIKKLYTQENIQKNKDREFLQKETERKKKLRKKCKNYRDEAEKSRQCNRYIIQEMTNSMDFSTKKIYSKLGRDCLDDMRMYNRLYNAECK